MGKPLTLSLDQIRLNPIKLRDCDTSTQTFENLCNSIRLKNLIMPLSVRERKDDDSGETFYELIDGTQRYTACKAVGLTEVPVHLMSADEIETLQLQLMANLHRTETKPLEYTEHLKRLFSMQPTLTVKELADQLGVTPQWIEARLALQKVTDSTIKSLIDEGKIKASNAFALAKLPEDEQKNLVDAAMTEGTTQFTETVRKRVKEIKEANRQGKDPRPAEFSPNSYLQKVSDIKLAVESKSPVPANVCKRVGANDAISGFRAALAWVLHLDPESVEAQKATWDKRQEEKARKTEERKKAREERKKAREQAKAEEAAEVAASV